MQETKSTSTESEKNLNKVIEIDDNHTKSTSAKWSEVPSKRSSMICEMSRLTAPATLGGMNVSRQEQMAEPVITSVSSAPGQAKLN